MCAIGNSFLKGGIILKTGLVFGRLEKNPGELQRVYDIGRADALTKLEQLKVWLNM